MIASQRHSVLGTDLPRRLLLALCCLLCIESAFATGDRHALVIGNAAYTSGTLANPVNDATDIAAKLRSFGFSVDLHTDADRRTMKRAIADFTRGLDGNDTVGLFYFAGHGVEYQGHNFLIPVDAEIDTEVDLEYEAVDAGRVLDGMDAAGNGLNLVVLDACRNNPFRSRFRSAARGLTRMTPARGTLVLYATQPGAVARDGEGRNGIFTRHLLEAMDTPGLEVEQVFKRSALAVDQETNGAQTPWVEGVVLGHFSFGPGSASHSSVEAATASRQPVRRPQTPPPPPTPVVRAATGHLQVNVDAKARVELDGRYVGEALPGHPLNISNLPVGSYQLAVSADGYVAESRSVQVESDRWRQEMVTLVPERVAPPPPLPTPSPTYSSTVSSRGSAPSPSGYLAAYSYVSGPSFRCSGRLQPAESIICDDPQLRRADGIMGAVYHDLRAALGSSAAKQVRSTQRQWIKQRDRACPTNASDLSSSSRRARAAACLRERTERRTSELWQMLQQVAGR